MNRNEKKVLRGYLVIGFFTALPVVFLVLGILLATGASCSEFYPYGQRPDCTFLGFGIDDYIAFQNTAPWLIGLSFAGFGASAMLWWLWMGVTVKAGRSRPGTGSFFEKKW